jgi:hypothetical protein
MTRVLRWGAGAALGTVLALAALACGPTAGSYCSDRRDCMGGNDKDEEACVDRFNAAESVLDDEGCGDEFDDYFECFFDTAKCVASPPAGPCQTTNDCGDAPFGATCQGGQCVVKDLALQGASDCAKEKLLFDSCNTLGTDPFQQ